MRKLIRKILKEQFEDYVFPEYDPIKKTFYDLNKEFKTLKKEMAHFDEGFVFAYPNEEFGVISWQKNGDLIIFKGVTNFVSTNFNLSIPDSELLIGKWITHTYGLEVKEEETWNTNRNPQFKVYDPNYNSYPLPMSR
jgi:hypothetical protein